MKARRTHTRICSPEVYMLKLNGKIHAISESPEELIQYKNQFPEYFSKFDCAIDQESHFGAVNYLLTKYESSILEWLTDDIIVTRWQNEYYVKLLKEAYKDTKAMMSQMLLFMKMSSLSVEEKDQIKKTFDMLYGHIKCYNDFVSHLDRNEIMKKYIVDPATCMEMIVMDLKCRIEKLGGNLDYDQE